jgi:ADP-L-glycero-D-manno-heptose 6-epimerase
MCIKARNDSSKVNVILYIKSIFTPMIIITGSAGFIASCMVAKLNEEGFNDLILSDDFSHPDREANYLGKKYTQLVHRDVLPEFIKENHRLIQMVIHLGARTDTTEFNYELLRKLNTEYTKVIWNLCVEFGLPLIYASSAATYGLGEFGYKDDHQLPIKLKPLNPYGESKNEFDIWALAQDKKPYFWAGLKFFNVYGPNEYHKGRMASVVFHAFNQIKQNGKVKLFRSHRPDYKDGEQLRDFVYVKDVAEVIFYLMNHRKDSGLYNLGTGKAESFLTLAKSTFRALNLEPVIEFVDTPADIRDKYQYFTEADMSKLKSIGYNKPFKNLQQGVEEYVTQYLNEQRYY